MSIVPATRTGNGAVAVRPNTAPAASSMVTLDELWQMAEHVAASKLFPVQNAQQAFTLMLVCQADGLHPIMAMRRYHVYNGRPSMRADAVQGEMQARGWKIRPVKRDAREARAVFAHPSHQPEGFELGVTVEQYKFLTGKDNWKNHPDDMLWARLVTKACRTLDPGIIAGIYSPEELEDMDEYRAPAVVHAQMHDAAAAVIRAADAPLPGDPEDGVDSRLYRAVACDVAAAVGYTEKDVHDHLTMRGVQCDRLPPDRPKTLGEAIKRITSLYQIDRPWVRDELAKFIATRTFVDRPADVDQPDPEFEPGSEG